MKKRTIHSSKLVLLSVGNQQWLGFLGVSPPSVNQWIKGVRQLPAERCPAIERATRGEVLCEELRPDIDWSYLRRSACCSQNMSVKQLNDSNKSSFDHT